MKELTTWTELFSNSLQTIGQTISNAAPKVLGAILILLLGWLFAKLVSNGIARLLKAIRFDDLSERINATSFLERANVKLAPSQFIGKFFYYVFLLLVVNSAAAALGWTAISEEISKLLSFLPNLLVAIIFFVVGSYIASFVRDIIKGATSSMGIGAGRIISNLVYYFLFMIVTLTALGQAGIDTTIISANLSLILGSILLSAAISYGFASRDVLANILASFFSRKTFAIGQIIELDDAKGKIIATSNISVTILTEQEEKIVIPAHQLITNKVKIIG